MQIKEEFIGKITSSKLLGQSVKIEHKHAEMFLNEGRLELLEGVKTSDALVPLKDKTIKEIRSIAKDFEGYTSKLNKKELIKLIENVAS
jgi:hypothetical protein